MRLIKVVITVATTIICCVASAQDPVFTDQSFGYAQVNPALTGTYGSLRIESALRIQWPKLQSDYRTMCYGFDSPTKSVGFGIEYTHDVAAEVLTTNRTALSLSYPIRLFTSDDSLGKVVIQPGFQVALHAVKLDFASLTFSDMIHYQNGFSYDRNENNFLSVYRNVDVSAGFVVYHKRFSAGAAFFHINEFGPEVLGRSLLPSRWVFHASGVIGNADNDFTTLLRVVPSLYFSSQNGFNCTTVSAKAYYENFNGGIGYRFSDALMLMCGYSRWNITLSYSYDVTLNNLKGISGVAHEAHLRFTPFESATRQRRINMRKFC